MLFIYFIYLFSYIFYYYYYYYYYYYCLLFFLSSCIPQALVPTYIRYVNIILFLLD